MSYSRWSNSRWYTFWHVRTPPENHNNAIFSICGLMDFQAAEIRKDIDKCLALVKDSKDGADATADEMKELRGYMTDFLADVDERYPRSHKTSKDEQ